MKESYTMKHVKTYGDWLNETRNLEEIDMEQLKSEASKIKHCGDYGHLFVKSNDVWWCCGDADGSGDDDTTTMDDIRSMLGSVPGVKKVTIEAECNPKEEEGWKKVEFKEKKVNEGAEAWSKEKLDSGLRELQAGAREAGDIDDSMAFDIADGWLSDNAGVEKAIKKWYPNVSDFSGFVANRIA